MQTRLIFFLVIFASLALRLVAQSTSQPQSSPQAIPKSAASPIGTPNGDPFRKLPENADLVPTPQSTPAAPPSRPNALSTPVLLNPKPQNAKLISPETREPTTAAAVPIYEDTSLSVERVIYAIVNGDANTPKRIPMEIPILYESHTLALTKDDLNKAKQLVARMKDYEKKLALDRAEGEEILKEWNALVKRSTPEGVLKPDSPSLLENQRTSQPGEGISIQP